MSPRRFALWKFTYGRALRVWVVETLTSPACSLRSHATAAPVCTSVVHGPVSRSQEGARALSVAWPAPGHARTAPGAPGLGWSGGWRLPALRASLGAAPPAPACVSVRVPLARFPACGASRTGAGALPHHARKTAPGQKSAVRIAPTGRPTPQAVGR